MTMVGGTIKIRMMRTRNKDNKDNQNKSFISDNRNVASGAIFVSGFLMMWLLF